MDGAAGVMGVVAVKFLNPIEKSTDEDYDASSWLSDLFLLFLFSSSTCLSNPDCLGSTISDTSIVLWFLQL